MLKDLKYMVNPRAKRIEAEAELLRCYQTIFFSPEGREVLRDLAAAGSFDRTTFDPQPTIASYNEGFRAAILLIYSKLQINIDQFLLENLQEIVEYDD